MATLGAEEAEKVLRSHLADAIADYKKLKSGVEAPFGKFEFEGSFRAQLRTHAQAGYSFRSLWTTSSRGWPIPQRAIIYCTTARAVRSPGKKSCRWRKHAKRRACYCTHPRPLQLQVRRSPRTQPLRVHVRTMR